MQAHATVFDAVDGPTSEVERATVAARLSALSDAVGATLAADTGSLVQQMQGVTTLGEKRDIEQRLRAMERAVGSTR